jgi:hypothetical protein
MPAITTTAPTANNYRPGDTLTLTGTNLNMITSVTFPLDSVQTLVVDTLSKDPLNIRYRLPIPKIMRSGTIYLNTVGKQSGTYTLTLQKPTLASTTPTGTNPNYINAGEPLTLTGANLDMVKAVRIGTFDVAPTTITATSIDLILPPLVSTSTVTAGAATTFTLTTEGGDAATFTRNIRQAQKPIVTSITPLNVGRNQLFTAEVVRVDMVTSINVPGAGASTYIKGPAGFAMYIPNNATTGRGKTFTLNYAGGSVETPPFEILGLNEPLNDNDVMLMNFDDRTKGWGDVGDILAGADSITGSKQYYHYTGGISNDWRTYFANNQTYGSGVTRTTHSFKVDVNVISVTGTQPRLRFRLGDSYVTWNITATGGWVTLTFPLNSGWSPNVTDANLANGGFEYSLVSGSNGNTGSPTVNMLIDNIRFHKN